MLTNTKTEEISENTAENSAKKAVLDIRQEQLNTLSIEGFGRSVRPGGGE